MNQLPYSQSCENNKAAISQVLETAFNQCTQVLEIGSGTGQHAVYFAAQLPHLIWQPSDQSVYLEGIKAWLAESPSPNLRAPLELDVTQDWPLHAITPPPIDAIFTANTLHIMAKELVELFFEGVGRHLADGGQLCIYGPFNYGGEYTSDSNRNFDVWLKARDERSAIRDFEWIDRLANRQGLSLVTDFTMPANNRLLHFEKIASGES